MKKNSEDLKSILKRTILFFSGDSDFSINIFSELNNKMDYGKVNDFLLYTNEKDIYFNDIEYCALTKAFLNGMKKFSSSNFAGDKQNIFNNLVSELNIDNWFTQQEIESSNLLYFNPKEEETDTIVIEGVVEVVPGLIYDCPKVSIRKLVEWYQNGISIYNFNTQRSPKITEKYGELIYEPTVNPDSVNNIGQDVADGVFKYNHVSYNILSTGEEKYNYDERAKSLKFTRGKGSQMNITDGYHRHEGFIKALLINPDCEHYSGLTITNYTVEQALEFVGQESKANTISAARAKSADNTPYAELVRRLNTEGNKNNNALFDKISITEEEVFKYHKKYIKFNIFTDAIEDNFHNMLNKPFDILQIKNYLQEFFNIVIGIFDEDFKNITQSQKVNYRTYENMFYGYTKLAELLYGKDDWQNTLIKIINNIDFSITNKVWDNARIKSSKFKNKSKKNIYEIFDKYYRNVDN